MEFLFSYTMFIVCADAIYVISTFSDERGCPLGQAFVSCANECPQRCSDLQQDFQCQDKTECQPGCRCPQGKQWR